MSSPQEFDSPPGPLQEKLVAYLDGELDADTAQELENLLATDPAARDEMQQLDQAWEMLDNLPRAEVDEAFTHSTIEMVAVSAEEEVERHLSEGPLRRRRQWLIGVGSLLAALGLGFLSVAALWPDANEQLLADLPVLERLDQYRQVQTVGVDFLRRLDERDLLPTSATVSHSEPTSLADRQMLVEQMSPAEKESLLRRQQRFAEFEPGEQQRLRSLHEEIQQDPQAASLRGTLAAYYDWLLQLSPSERASLASLAADARLEKIEALRDEERKRELYKTSPADKEAIAGWLEEQIRCRLPKDARPAQYEDLSPVERRGAIMLMGSTQLPGGVSSVPQYSEEVVASLRKELSPEGQAKLDQIKTEEQWRRVVTGWGDGWFSQAIRDSIRKYYDSLLADVRKEDIVRFFEELPETERAELLGWSSEAREFRLRMMYLKKHKSDRLPEFARDGKPDMWWLRNQRGDGRWTPRGGSRQGPPSPGPRPRPREE